MTEQNPYGIDPEMIPSPCYVLDEKKLKHNLNLLEDIKNRSGICILLALKGFAMWSTFPLINKYLDGASASSLNEAKLCMEEFGSKAHLCAPVYLESEINEITEISSHITFNSLQQFYRFRDHAVKKNLKIAIRINPEYSEVSPPIYNPCIPGSRLGMTSIELGENLPGEITGMHFHTLCEQNADALENTIKAIEQKFEHILHHAKWLNIGGGHQFTNEKYDLDRFIMIITSIKNKYGLKIFAEPGETIVWKTGCLVSTVQDVVDANGYKTAMLDVSFSAHMPDCLEMPYKPNIWGALEPSYSLPTYRMGGNTCLAGDFIGDYAFETPLNPGDKIIFDDMIHYTMVKSNTFNGVNLPSIGIWKEDNSFKLIKSFGYEEYKSRLS